ncbi:MAG TPA: hypothetical protein VHY78_07000 [Stellaceae bacterium]|nr:hypothetical protein [Stellaceae bacterium]
MIHYDPGVNRLPNRAYWRGTGPPDRLPEEVMNWRRRLAALFVVVAFAGCVSVAAGPRQPPNPPYQQGDPRDTSGMH